MKGWVRALLLVASLVALSVAILMIIFPLSFGTSVLVALFAIALVIIGIELLVVGASGAPMRRTAPAPTPTS